MRWSGLVFALAALAPAVVDVTGALAGTPRGPAFGTTRYRSEISEGTHPDADDFVSPLARGERLDVVVSAERGSALRPRVVLVGPGGEDATPELQILKGGRALALRDFEVPETGPWAVRVEGAGSTTGAYSVRFRVRPAAPVVLTRLRLGGGEPLERGHVIEAVDGTRLTIDLRRRGRGGQAAVGAVAGPSGDPVVLAAPRVKGARTEFRDVVLDRGHGAYTVSVGIEEGAAEYDVRIARAPPERPSGTLRLTADEPRIERHGTPATGNARTPYRVRGAGFSVFPPPRVFFGGREALVLQRSTDGSYVDVGPPEFPDGTVVEVALANPDGQADVEDAWFRYVPPEQPALRAITPGVSSMYTGDLRRFSVELERPAPVTGAAVALTLDAPLGTLPALVVVPAFASSATFDLRAGSVAGKTSITASLADRSLTAEVAVVLPPYSGGGEPPPPLPDEIDIGLWTIAQTNSARTFTIPKGTRLRAGDYVIVSRTSSPSSFESYWGVKLGTNVVFLSGEYVASNSGDDWPSINGDESFELRDAKGVVVDGPTIAMQAGGGASYRRAAGHPSLQPSSWTEGSPDPGTPDPGSGQPPVPVGHGVFISEFTDAAGSGNYIYEFVELHFDGFP